MPPIDHPDDWHPPPRPARICTVCQLYIQEDEPYIYNATDREYRHARREHCPVWRLLGDDDE